MNQCYDSTQPPSNIQAQSMTMEIQNQIGRDNFDRGLLAK